MTEAMDRAARPAAARRIRFADDDSTDRRGQQQMEELARPIDNTDGADNMDGADEAVGTDGAVGRINGQNESGYSTYNFE